MLTLLALYYRGKKDSDWVSHLYRYLFRIKYYLIRQYVIVGILYKQIQIDAAL